MQGTFSPSVLKSKYISILKKRDCKDLENYRVSRTKVSFILPLKPNNPNHKWVLRGQIFIWTQLGIVWSCLVLVRNNQNKNSRHRLVQVLLPASGDWTDTPWLQQHSEKHFFLSPCRSICEVVQERIGVVDTGWRMPASTALLLVGRVFGLLGLWWWEKIDTFHPCDLQRAG